MCITEEIVSKYRGKKGVVLTKMFGALALKIDDKVFMLSMRDGIVFKLHPDDVPAALSINGAELFDAHKNGKRMKEWVHFPANNITRDCVEIAERSFQYIKKIKIKK